MLEKIDLSLKLDRKEYEEKLAAIQLRLVRIEQQIREEGTSVVVMYEGWDASGKGGSILRITEKLDPRGYHVWPICAPNEIEKKYNYLWRFWTHMPAKGQIAIFDRSWYGRVLVERVEKLCCRDDWERAYDEINDFEEFLTDNGTVLIKFWMQISKDEQLRRFNEREADPYKQWKIGPEDWRNREKWDKYLDAAEDMLDRTDTKYAPWHIIPAENKHYARIETARIVADRIEKAL